MIKTVGLASLYEPLEFLEHRIENLNCCDMDGTCIYFMDCSDAKVQAEAHELIRTRAKFQYRWQGLAGKKDLYRVWNMMVSQAMCDPTMHPVYFCAVNVDDIQAPNYFREMMFFLDEHPDIVIVSPQWYASKTKGQYWPPAEKGVFVDPDVHRTLGHFPMWRARLHDELGNFNPLMRVVGDSEFWDRIKKRYGYGAIAVLEKPLALYLDHEKNLYKTSKLANGMTGEAMDRKLMGL